MPLRVCFATVLLDGDGVGVLEGGEALDVADAVLLEEHPDAAALGGHDLLLAGHDGVEVEGHVALDLDAELGGVLDVVEPLDAGDEGLAGDAAPVEAGAAEVLLLDHDDLRAELGGADRRHVAAGAGADHDKVRIEAVVRHSAFSLLGRGHGPDLVDQGLDRGFGDGGRSVGGRVEVVRGFHRGPPRAAEL